tara:strand:+ start:661 stop:1452 length:792 start_codon:yes stop_codon:yes gene_type:complete
MDRTTIKSTLFPVKEIPAIWTDKDNGNILNKNTGHKFIIREDTDEVLSCMTDSYKLITNNELYDIVNPVMKECGAHHIESRTFSDGARTSWKWKFPDISVDIGNGDFVNPEMTIRNSYDGSLEASALAGAFRLVCSNGMVIGFILSKTGIRHIGKHDPNEFINVVNDTIEKTKLVFNEDFPKFSNTKINNTDITKLIELFPTGHIVDALVTNIIGKPPKTYWDLLNAATWVATHYMNRNREATHKMESKIYPTILDMANKAIA